MRKRLLLTLLIPMLLFTGCGMHTGAKDYKNNTDKTFQNVDGKEWLYYDKKTKIVYVIFNEFTTNTGYGYMSPYYAPNGKPYRYIDGELKEIEE